MFFRRNTRMEHLKFEWCHSRSENIINTKCSSFCIHFTIIPILVSLSIGLGVSAILHVRGSKLVEGPQNVSLRLARKRRNNSQRRTQFIVILPLATVRLNAILCAG